MGSSPLENAWSECWRPSQYDECLGKSTLELFEWNRIQREVTAQVSASRRRSPAGMIRDMTILFATLAMALA